MEAWERCRLGDLAGFLRNRHRWRCNLVAADGRIARNGSGRWDEIAAGDMEITQCRYFLALCKERSFTRAARRCGVAQPSLTRAIRNLERELGESLFERRPSGATLTAFGENVFPYFAVILRCVAEIKRGPQNILAADGKSTKEIVRASNLTSRVNGSHQFSRNREDHWYERHHD
jgi:molybdenum-dependent DNA-binding transcriptional regulator ModE